MRRILVTCLLAFVALAVRADDNGELKAIGAVLDKLHATAAQADGETYFALFTEDARFIGTDVTEFWTIEDFKAYAKPYFDAGRGWEYTVRERKVDLGPAGNVAWFHEVLDNEKYGTTRGTGVLVRVPGKGWFIAQYHLAIPVPNDVAEQVTGRIKEFEGK